MKIGECFNQYEIIKQIGAGGMGEVYLAKDKKLERKVAVKILNERFSRDESNLRRFTQEAKAASALNHPNILVIHEIGEADDVHFIVSEFVEGKTLREILNQSSLKLSEVLDVSIQIANALSAAHTAHIVHRDIKPDNVIIRPDGYVKILDFGLAKLVEQKAIGFEDETAKQNQTAKGVILGTVKYMSPEQAKGELVDGRTDIFSFGVLLYEMIAGRTPFAGNTMSETLANLINAEPQPIARYADGAPDELQRIVSKMLRKNKDERYHTVKALLTDLKDLRENLVFGERLEKSHPPSDENATAILQTTIGDAKQTIETQHNFSQKMKPHKSLAAFGLIVLLAAIGLGVWYFTNRIANTKQIETIAVDATKPALKSYWQMAEAEQLAFIKERARHIQTLIGDEPMEFDEESSRAIKVEIDDYVEEKDSLSQKPFEEGLRVIYGRASQYAPLIIRAYEARQVPPALGLYQAMVESEYHDCLISERGSVGLFQFAPKTAAKYGLTAIDYCNVEKQSDAAARYMSDLTSDFGDEKSIATLVLFGYVVGENGVRDYLRQLHRRGITERNFWAVSRHQQDLQPPLKDDGKEYVPRFFAVAIIGETPDVFELSTPPLTTLREKSK